MVEPDGKGHGNNPIPRIEVGSRDVLLRLRLSRNAAEDRYAELLRLDAAAPETDCCHWLPGGLDLEPEACFCLAHGAELPCTVCEPASSPEPKEKS